MPAREKRTIHGGNNRFALVIGNNAYQQGAKLSKAVNDAEDIHQLLKDAGFQSTLVTNATYDEMLVQKGVRLFVRA